MAYAFVQATYTSAATGGAMAFGSNNTAGNCLVISACWTSDIGAPTISDTRGNTYALAKYDSTLGGSRAAGVWVAFNCAAGANSVTLTSAGQSFDAILSEYSGLSAVDQVAGAHNASTNPASGNTPSTTSAVEMVFGFAASTSQSMSAGSGFTSRANGVNNMFVRSEDKRVTSTGVQSADFTAASSSWECICVTIAEPGAASALGSYYYRQVAGMAG